MKLIAKAQGRLVSDPEVNKAFEYFLLAYYFGWTPEQADKVEAKLLSSLLVILPKWIEKTRVML